MTSRLKAAWPPLLPESISGLRLLTCLCFAMLLLTPIVAYWPTISHEYGLRDDYSRLREVREEPNKTVDIMASDGRPIGGFLLERSLRWVYDVTDLPWLRLAGVLLLTATGVALWSLLRRSGWPELDAAAVGLGMTLLPGCQVIAGWAIAWPIALGLLLAVVGFGAVEAWVSRGTRRSALIFGCLCYVVAALTYQSSALFAVVPLAAVLLTRPPERKPTVRTWTIVHLGTLLACLVAAFGLLHLLFALGVFEASSRLELEADPLGKLVWFVSQPLANALALYALRDDFAFDPIFWLTVAGISTLIALGWRADTRARPTQSSKWALCIFVLPLLGHGVSLAAAERAIGYRTLIALSGLALVLLVFSLRSIASERRLKTVARYSVLTALIFVAAGLADHDAFSLIAVPQGNEWTIVRNATHRLVPQTDTRVYIVTPTLDDRSTTRVFADEFGSLSADSDWAPKEMFKAALRQRFRSGLPVKDIFTVTLGRVAPVPTKHYNLVIDMRQLKRLRHG